jgi:hypothetical protein
MADRWSYLAREAAFGARERAPVQRMTDQQSIG